MKTTLAIGLLVAALIVSNAAWFFVVPDQGITRTYLQQSIDLSRKQYEQAVRLANLELKGLTTAEAMQRIGLDVHGFRPFVKEGCLWAGEVCVTLEDGRVSGMRHDTL